MILPRFPVLGRVWAHIRDHKGLLVLLQGRVYGRLEE